MKTKKSAPLHVAVIDPSALSLAYSTFLHLGKLYTIILLATTTAFPFGDAPAANGAAIALAEIDSTSQLAARMSTQISNKLIICLFASAKFSYSVMMGRIRAPQPVCALGQRSDVSRADCQSGQARRLQNACARSIVSKCAAAILIAIQYAWRFPIFAIRFSLDQPRWRIMPRRQEWQPSPSSWFVVSISQRVQLTSEQ